jgi:hypothetical protein
MLHHASSITVKIQVAVISWTYSRSVFTQFKQRIGFMEKQRILSYSSNGWVVGVVGMAQAPKWERHHGSLMAG